MRTGLPGLCLAAWIAWLAPGAAVASAPERTMLAEPPAALPAFQLTDQRGRPFKSSQFAGSPSLVFFGFTHCPSICPGTLQRLRLFVDKHPEFRTLKVVLISVDGDRDSPEVMAEYLANFSPDFIGLTGTPAKVASVAQGFKAAFFKGPVAQGGGYNVDHSSQVYLVDSSYRLRATFFNAPDEAMASVIRSLDARAD